MQQPNIDAVATLKDTAGLGVLLVVILASQALGFALGV